MAASTSAPYRSWDHSGDGLPTYTDDTDVFTEDNWNKWLRGTLTGKSGTNGLGKNKAYYELLKLEMKGNTIVTFGEDGEKFVDDSFIGVVWDENGNLLTDAGGTVIGSTIFDGDPEAVTGWYAYTAAIANAQAAITANNHTADQQDSVVDALAYAVYEARNALKARNFSANSVPYQEAIGYAATYEAMLVKLNITEYMVVDGEPSNNTSHTVDLYKNVDEEFVNMVTAFKATYAVPNNDTPYESTDAMRAAKAAIDRYIAGYRENDTEGNPSAAPIEIRTMADDEIKLGFVDLCNSFIAGTFTPGTFDDEGKYTDGTYTSSVISNGINDNTANQSAEIQAKLNELYKFQFVKSKNASTDLIGALNGATDILYTYLTETPATDLQFAVHMRDNELLYFLRAGIEGSVPFYYGGNGEYVIPLFNQNTVDQIEEDVNNFFDKLNKGTWELADGNQIGWPKIYEVNNITWNKAAAEAKEKREAVVITGYEGDTSTHTYTGDIVAVVEILNQVGACCLNYVTAAGNVNKFNLKPYEWLQKNAVSSTKAEETVVLAVNKKLGTNDPKAYETPDWYAGDNYAYFKDNDGNYYCADWFVDFNDTLGTFMSPKGEMKDTLAYAEEYNLDIWVVGDDKAEHYYEYLNEVAWSPSHLGKLKDWAGEYQSMYDGFAQEYYEAICALQLLPATDAYRDVYNTYLSVKGLHIDDGNWIDDSFSSGTTSNVDFKFYNLLDATQLSRIAGMYNKLYDDALPPYGTVLRASYNDFLNKYTQSNEYVANETNNPWYNMEQYIDDLIDGGAVITIDQAEKVNTYNKDDNIPSIMETLVDVYLSKLEFDDLVYDNLDAVVKAFLGDNLSNGLADIKEKLEAKGFTVGGNYGGQFYELNYYTNESLLQVAGILRSQNVLASNKIIEQEIGEVDKYYWVGETFPLPIEFDISYKGTFYTSTTDQKRIDSSKEEDHSVLLAFLTALNTKLELKPVDTDGYKNSVGADIPGIEQAIAAGNLIVETKAKYDTGDTSWDAFVTELEKAENLFAQASTYNITDQDMFDQQASDLYTAINNLKLRADDYAPQMTLKTSVSAVEEFYSHPAYEVALNQKDSVSYTVTQADGKTTYDAHPAAGTFFIPNSSGYSLIVYTNELNPRIVINLEDLEKVLEEGTNDSEAVVQDAAKKEYISINAKKTSGVETNVIAGTIVHDKNNSANNTMDITASGIANGTAAIGVENNTGKTNSSAFAILAPKFVDGKTTQAAVYTIEARDGSARSTDTGTIAGNPAEQFDFGGDQKPIDIVRDNNGKIAIYIYYYSLKAKDGTDEGINATGTALAEPAISGTNVPYTLLSGEPGFEGKDWRNGILLQRHFSDSHRVWEYVSEVKKNADGQYNVNGAQVPVYNDPTFGYLNTGSFYYVLDDEADADIITAYHTAKSSSTTAGCMDYAAATVAKTAMISAINAANATKLSEMKASGRFYNYGDYYTDANGKVLYNGEEPQWVNWAQAIGGKVDNGDLVFVHVVDRWGNVVNRIVEITNLDKSSPEVNTATAGTVTINEAGGSGLADIQVHNGDFSLGEFEYEVNTEQKPLENPQITNKATVECANNKLTIKGLVPGKTYLIGAEDKAGNRSTTAVKADTNGYIVITIDNEIVQTGEDMGFEGNSSTFTLNGTDTIILNAGEASSVINASIEGNVFANRYIKHYVTTTDSVTALKTVYQDGTAEEFTAEKTVVTVNGDGTLTWEIRRKLAEGEHKYKVYAKVNGEYESFFATATINATNKKVRFECTNVGQGAIQLFYSGALYTQDVSNYISTDIPYGAKVTVAAKAYTAYEGCEFYYWINNITDRIINTADVYEFKAVSNVDYIAQFTNNSTCIDGKKFVVYVNNAKNVVERFELADGETYTVPTGPVLPDYTFKGWSMTKAEVLASDKDTIIVEPIYELNASNTVTITEGNYTATGAGTYTAEDNQRAVVTISTDAKDGDGKEFLYWIDADTDEIVSYDRTYSFFCVKDTQLTPVYGDASTVTAEPIVRITEVKFNALSGKVSFFAERSVPEEFVILQTGIVVTKTESIGTNEEVFVVGGTSTAAGTSTSTANNGYYSANAAVATGQTVWARAYVIYETADGEILEAYGPVVSYTVD
ncbi:MAG: hypothetical protein IKK49_05075 [Clostridia bacterium]|nr:hypothetical protein [Clostridia bacterium]